MNSHLYAEGNSVGNVDPSGLSSAGGFMLEMAITTAISSILSSQLGLSTGETLVLDILLGVATGGLSVAPKLAKSFGKELSELGVRRLFKEVVTNGSASSLKLLAGKLGVKTMSVGMLDEAVELVGKSPAGQRVILGHFQNFWWLKDFASKVNGSFWTSLNHYSRLRTMLPFQLLDSFQRSSFSRQTKLSLSCRSDKVLAVKCSLTS